MSSDTWSNIQEQRRRQESLRERLLKRRRERKDLTATLVEQEQVGNTEIEDKLKPEVIETVETQVHDPIVTPVDPQVEVKLQEYLSSSSNIFPLSFDSILEDLNKILLKEFDLNSKQLEILLQKQTAQNLIQVSTNSAGVEEVTSVEIKRLSALLDTTKQPIVTKKKDEVTKKSERSERKRKALNRDDDLEALLSTKSSREQDSSRVSEEIQNLLSTATTKELTLAHKFKSMGGSQVREFCPYATREECLKHQKFQSCSKLHFRKILRPHTDESLGDCSFLNTCFHTDTCKYVHYEIDHRGASRRRRDGGVGALDRAKMLPPQWISCDIRYLDLDVLGKFSVIMADPPWDIHMELPYGTMQDEEMRNMRIQDLSDDGLMFLWVTGRAMELGRELFEIWGYKRCDELIWVKTNQLQRLIRTGRTGHWINHGKEHCLVGIKGNPKGINRRLDCDVLVAEVRDTSHKPDEIYGIIERLSPGTRKLELFGRMHNVQPNWVTLGNQLDGVNLAESEVVSKFRAKYPDGKVTKPEASKQQF